MTRLVFVANGAMGAKCVSMALAAGGFEVMAVYSDAAIPNRELSRLCHAHGIPHRDVNALGSDVEARSIEACDYGVNVDSRRLLPPRIVDEPACGFINFHNSYLPKYRGLNVCSWAILNGELTHGATWHFINHRSGIDSGAVLAQRDFKIEPEDTAASLILRSIDAGIRIFPDVLRKMRARARDTGSSAPISTKLYLRRELPNGGFVPLKSGFEIAWRFLRALDFRPFQNDFIVPRVSIGEDVFEVLAYRGAAVPSSSECDEPTLQNCGSGIRVAGGILWFPKLRRLAPHGTPPLNR